LGTTLLGIFPAGIKKQDTTDGNYVGILKFHKEKIGDKDNEKAIRKSV